MHKFTVARETRDPPTRPFYVSAVSNASPPEQIEDGPRLTRRKRFEDRGTDDDIDIEQDAPALDLTAALHVAPRSRCSSAGVDAIEDSSNALDMSGGDSNAVRDVTTTVPPGETESAFPAFLKSLATQTKLQETPLSSPADSFITADPTATGGEKRRQLRTTESPIAMQINSWLAEERNPLPSALKRRKIMVNFVEYFAQGSGNGIDGSRTAIIHGIACNSRQKPVLLIARASRILDALVTDSRENTEEQKTEFILNNKTAIDEGSSVPIIAFDIAHRLELCNGVSVWIAHGSAVA